MSIGRRLLGQPGLKVWHLAATVFALSVVCVAPAALADAKSALPPGSGTLKLTHPAEVFTPSTLDQHIDGEAQAVKQYDFHACAYGEYAPGGKGTQLITADVYDMGSPQDAYGYYSHQRSLDAHLVKIGAEGYVEATALNFWKGQYYVKLAITAANPAPFQPQMPMLAAAIASKLTGSTAKPAILSLLPPGFKPLSDVYQRSDIAAQSFINNGVLARYPAAGQQAELFIAIFPTPGAAASAFTRYSAYLSQPSTAAANAKPSPIRGLGEKAIAVKTKFSGQVVAALKGKYLVGVRKATGEPAATTLVKAAIARLK